MVKKKVLLADDDADDVGLLNDFFIKHNEITLLPSAENGLELIDILKSISNPSDLPDLIILDQNMPLMTGKQTLTYLKSQEKYSHIPVVVYSTYSDTHLVSDCSKLGAALVTSKPSTFEGYNEMMMMFLQVLNS